MTDIKSKQVIIGFHSETGEPIFQSDIDEDPTLEGKMIDIKQARACVYCSQTVPHTFF
jgi:hypothetical protein